MKDSRSWPGRDPESWLPDSFSCGTSSIGSLLAACITRLKKAASPSASELESGSGEWTSLRHVLSTLTWRRNKERTAGNRLGSVNLVWQLDAYPPWWSPPQQYIHHFYATRAHIETFFWWTTWIWEGTVFVCFLFVPFLQRKTVRAMSHPYTSLLSEVGTVVRLRCSLAVRLRVDCWNSTLTMVAQYIIVWGRCYIMLLGRRVPIWEGNYLLRCNGKDRLHGLVGWLKRPSVSRKRTRWVET